MRRRRETVRDLDLIATSSDPPALIDAFCDGRWVAEVVARGETKATVVGHDGLRFDLRVVPPGVLRQRAPALHGLEGSQHRAPRGRAAPRALDLRVRRDERRDGRGGDSRERGRALRVSRLRGRRRPSYARERTRSPRHARATLPALVELGDLRGEMHCHSTWSADGRNSIEEMALTAKGRGYRFMCITDHSHYLRDGRLEAQWRGDRGAEHAARALHGPARDRGEHPRRRLARRRRRHARRSSTG